MREREREGGRERERGREGGREGEREGERERRVHIHMYSMRCVITYLYPSWLVVARTTEGLE